MPIEIRELEILAEPQAEARGGDSGDARQQGPGALEIEHSLLAWHGRMVLRADRLRAD